MQRSDHPTMIAASGRHTRRRTSALPRSRSCFRASARTWSRSEGSPSLARCPTRAGAGPSTRSPRRRRVVRGSPHRCRPLGLLGCAPSGRHDGRVRRRRRLRRPSGTRRVHDRRRAVRPHRVVRDAGPRGRARGVPRSGARDSALRRHRRVDRKLVASGDTAWRDAIAVHYSAVRADLERFNGHEIDRAGDGVLREVRRPARALRCAARSGGARRREGCTSAAGVHAGEVALAGDRCAGSPSTKRPDHGARGAG